MKGRNRREDGTTDFFIFLADVEELELLDDPENKSCTSPTERERSTMIRRNSPPKTPKTEFNTTTT